MQTKHLKDLYNKDSLFTPEGNDCHSIVVDPKCRNLAGFDFTLTEDSPVFEIGFEPFDLSDVRPRWQNHAGAHDLAEQEPSDQKPGFDVGHID